MPEVFQQASEGLVVEQLVFVARTFSPVVVVLVSVKVLELVPAVEELGLVFALALELVMALIPF